AWWSERLKGGGGARGGWLAGVSKEGEVPLRRRNPATGVAPPPPAPADKFVRGEVDAQFARRHLVARAQRGGDDVGTRQHLVIAQQHASAMCVTGHVLYAYAPTVVLGPRHRRLPAATRQRQDIVTIRRPEEDKKVADGYCSRQNPSSEPLPPGRCHQRCVGPIIAQS